MKSLLLGVLLACVYNSLAIPSPVRAITDDELCKAWAVMDEARGEPVKGQKAVLDVIELRMKKRNMTACEVVKQPHQFSGYKKGMKFELHKNVSEKSLTKLWMLDNMEPSVSGATHFHSVDVHPFWSKQFKKLKKIGHHLFYNEKEK